MIRDQETGFTGTRSGLTDAQFWSLWEVMGLLIGWWHHGDCVGADEESHKIARRLGGLRIAIHPPTVSTLRAYCQGDRLYPAKPYLERNHEIVDVTTHLIAAPATMTEQLRSGTWATVRYARSLGRPVTLVYPDGTVSVSNGNPSHQRPAPDRQP